MSSILFEDLDVGSDYPPRRLPLQKSLCFCYLCIKWKSLEYLLWAQLGNDSGDGATAELGFQ